jgi:hypothetical protein
MPRQPETAADPIHEAIQEQVEADIPVSTQLLLGATSGAVTWWFIPISPEWALLSVILWWIVAMISPKAAERVILAAVTRTSDDAGEGSSQRGE